MMDTHMPARGNPTPSLSTSCPTRRSLGCRPPAGIRRPPLIILLASLAAFLHQKPAEGHTLLLSRGDVSLHADYLTVHLQVEAEDFLHWYGLSTDSDGCVSAEVLAATARKHEALLEETLVIRDQAGQRLSNREFRLDQNTPESAGRSTIELKTRRFGYTGRFEMPDRPTWLAFQLLPTASGTSAPWRLLLRLHGIAEGTRTLTLTSRGNLEIVPLQRGSTDWQLGVDAGNLLPSACAKCGERGAEQLREVCVDFVIAGNQLEANVQIPLALLATFREFAFPADEFLAAPARDALLESAADLLAKRLSVAVDGSALHPEVMSTSVANPFESDPVHAPPTQPVSYWLGSLRARIRFRSDQPLARAAIRWNLFNSAILSARYTIESGTTCTEHEFSTYRPRYEWIKPRAEHVPK